MRKTASRSVALTLAAAVTGSVSVLALAAAPAEAAPAKATSLYAPSALVLTISDGESAATSAPKRAVTLSCTPSASGTHPAAEDACAQLRAADGNFDGLAVDEERMCTRDWRPVVVTAQGVWQGERVSYEKTFSNPCVKNAEGAAVFAF
ncbi:protease inhibitor protein [Streptomyces albus subsp. chlorinus]|uniref:subtilase-type protease inhibitor n=1 Tax=Streptomyces albus TaxID=1888 RepID=UPI00156FAE2B|nr:subtilase-type protease inhibitor [Streptomyces albus]NSC20315.1 protease inhibitor protein [Streptomyces albus subsp. chlorinus]